MNEPTNHSLVHDLPDIIDREFRTYTAVHHQVAIVALDVQPMVMAEEVLHFSDY